MREFRGLVLLCVFVPLMSGCGAGADEAEPSAEAPPAAIEEVAQEEVRTAPQDVPEPIRLKAESVLARVGGDVSCAEWYWDSEDDAWECVVAGHDRALELDLTPEGEFSELEYEFTGEEVLATVPYLAELIESTCEDPAGAVIELSMRREEFVGQEPDLSAWWEQDDLFFEVQCPDGYDFEVDAYGTMVTDSDDDVDKD